MKGRRTNWFCSDLSGDSSEKLKPESERYVVSGYSEANLVSSLLDTGRHAPTLDIDHHCKLIGSSTPGNFHLYIDVDMPWWKYRLLLKALAFTGIIEKGYYGASVAKKKTFVRKPGIVKKKLA